MDNIADELRQVFVEQAEAAPPGLELLAASRARSRQRQLRRRVGVTSLVALAVIAGAATVPLLVRGPAALPNGVAAGGPKTGSPPTKTATASPTGTDTAIRFAPATTQPTVTFPYSPTFVPAGLPRAAVFLTESAFLGHMRQQNQSTWLKVELGSTAPNVAKVPGLDGALPQAVRVHGILGDLIIARNEAFLYWQESPGVWLSITSVGVSRADVLSYAEGLRAVPLTGTEAFHFALLPVGMTPYESLHWSEAFGVTGSSDPGAGPGVGVVVNLNATLPTDGQVVRVGSRNGWLGRSDDGSLKLAVDLGHHAVLQVITGSGCTDANLISFAAGITVDLNAIS